MNRGAKAAKAMFLYAAIMVAGGVVAYLLAPETANATTALVVPVACAGAMVLSGLLSLAISKKYIVGMIGIHLGLVLPVLFAAVIGMRAVKTGDAVTAYHDAQAAWEVQAATPETAALPPAEQDAARTELWASLDAPDHDKSYLRNTLWFLAVASAGAFVVILSTRPKKEDRGAA